MTKPQQWADTGWWRVLDNAGKLWCETSSEDEALDAMDTCPNQPTILMKHQETFVKTRWVLTEPS